MQSKLWEFVENGARANLYSPTAMPRASGFLWNHQMMIQMNCRGFAVAQFMQPEPAKYAYAPNLEAKTFMQPEQPYYAHHPGRFFYIKDEDSGEIFSAPYEPVRAPLESFCFSAGTHDLRWTIKHKDLRIELTLSLSREDVIELWSFNIHNEGEQARNISVYPYFTIGYMSWMNQGAAYDSHLGGIIARAITPYQKVEDYFKHLNFKENTFFLHDTQSDSFECSRERFEGEGGLHNPSGLQTNKLENGDALYETPAAVLQYRCALKSGDARRLRFLFGPAHDDAEIKAKRDHYFGQNQFDKAANNYQRYVHQGQGSINCSTPDTHLDTVINQWLPRQIFYHGDVNRLTTDPQTRNYLQDNMGMAYIDPKVTKAAFLHALSQQEASGAMPDGIKLSDEAELKYINQIPHTDHCVWLPVCLQAYLDETGDSSILNEMVSSSDGRILTVSERISAAMHWLLQARDDRGLSLIAQGDWCDPMNMVGYKGKGVSAWLSVATSYALRLWSDVCASQGADIAAETFRDGALAINEAVNKYLWDGAWFARGITDDGVTFGIADDKEGRIFLNPQSWALLARAADKNQRASMLTEIERQLETPYGVAMLAPAYTKMRDDVGRVTQKFPGSAENGSVYNHAAIFYIYSLYTLGEGERAFKLLRQMIPGPDKADVLQRGQLPIFVPNYYRGAYYQHPRTAGRSSQLFNTGTVSWLYRCILEGLFGLRGCAEGLNIAPQLPVAWRTAHVQRRFRSATFEVFYEKRKQEQNLIVEVNGNVLERPVIENVQANAQYDVKVWIDG